MGAMGRSQSLMPTPPSPPAPAPAPPTPHEREGFDGVAVTFPGQGSQVAGFGRAWRDHPAWVAVERAEEASGRALSPLLLDPDADLSRTEDAQLAVLASSLLVWEAARDYIGTPVAFAGHSLGQITALVAAGAVDPAAGLALASTRAAVTQAAADATPGGLIALLGATPEQARDTVALVDEAWIANDNAPGQIVVGGTTTGVAAAQAAARGAGVRKVRGLAVGGAFHTPLMAPAAEAFGAAVAEVDFAPLTAPVVTNHDATAHFSRRGWSERLATHLVRPVRWRETVDALVELGARRLVELGPGTTLTALAKRCRDDVEPLSAATPDEVEALLPALWGVSQGAGR
jgi:[acyl-carrier-protein] S-malonyltransferase